MKLHSLPITVASLAIASIVVACGDTDSIGSSLIQTDNEIIIEDNFQLTGLSVDNSRVQSRTAMLLLGTINTGDFGNFSSDFVTQFMPVSKLDTNLVAAADIDSVKLNLLFEPGSFVGDSIIPMGLEVYRLNRSLETPIFSDFDPADYYDASGYLGSTIYQASTLDLPDSLAELDYREIYVDLPRELGVELFDLYQTNPAAYNDPALFAKHFPGIYVRNSYGSGRVTQLGASIIQFFYHRDMLTDEGNDTTCYYTGTFFSATPEVLSNNNISYTVAPQLIERAEAGEPLIIAPAGMDVEMRFPLPEIVQYYREHAGRLAILNNLTLSIPAADVTNAYGIEPPETLLMVLKKDRESFFANGDVTDGEISFYGTYSATTDTYEFTSLRTYLLNALKSEEEITEEDYTFILTPVTMTSESVYNSDYGTYQDLVTEVAPYVVQPTMTSLRLDKAEIILTMTNQKAN